MLQSSEDAPRLLAEGSSVVGSGWKEVDNFEDLSDIDEYESDEEEEYVILDLGQAVENKLLQTENSYQLIGIDTPIPFFKLGNQIYQGEVSRLIGEEVILGLIRNQENPHYPSRPPIHSTSSRLVFRPVTLPPRDDTSAPTPATAPAFTPKIELGLPPSQPINMEWTRTSEMSLPTSTPMREISQGPSPVAGPSSVPDTAAGRRSASQSVPPSIEPKHGTLKGLVTGSKESKMVISINKLAELYELDTTSLASHMRIKLDKSIETALHLEIPPEKAKYIAKRGYTPRQIAKIREGKPLLGKGSRIPRSTGIVKPRGPRIRKKKDKGKAKGTEQGGEGNEVLLDGAEPDGENDDGEAPLDGDEEEDEEGEAEEGDDGDEEDREGDAEGNTTEGAKTTRSSRTTKGGKQNIQLDAPVPAPATADAGEDVEMA